VTSIAVHDRRSCDMYRLSYKVNDASVFFANWLNTRFMSAFSFFMRINFTIIKT